MGVLIIRGLLYEVCIRALILGNSHLRWLMSGPPKGSVEQPPRTKMVVGPFGSWDTACNSMREGCEWLKPVRVR